MIAVDANILVYAHRDGLEQHDRARTALERLVRSGAPWALPWPAVHEFLAVTTDARLWPTPTPVETALEQIENLIELPRTRLLGEPLEHWTRLAGLLKASRTTGKRVYDASIAAICLAHGVRELWTADRHYGAFPELKTRNPLVG